MALGSIKEAYNVFQQHDFSRNFQLRFLDIQTSSPVGAQVRDELVGMDGRYYITTMVVPGRSIQNVDVPYQGFQFKLPGQVAYDSPNPWTLNFRTAGDYLVRNALERLSFATANDDTACGAFNLPCKNNIITIGVLNPKCEIIRAYDLIGFYIQNISEISYNQETVEGTTFTAAFHYQYWRPNASVLGEANLGVAPSNLDRSFDTFSTQLQNVNTDCGVGTPIINTVL
jgi:hypothetical protein